MSGGAGGEAVPATHPLPSAMTSKAAAPPETLNLMPTPNYIQ